jgi:hypothetical protein
MKEELDDTEALVLEQFLLYPVKHQTETRGIIVYSNQEDEVLYQDVRWTYETQSPSMCARRLGMTLQRLKVIQASMLKKLRHDLLAIDGAS